MSDPNPIDLTMRNAEQIAPLSADNIQHMRGNRRALKPRAQELLTHVTHAGDITPQLNQSYLVKGWLARGAVSMLYGPSNTGKSFLALDIAHHVAKGAAWGGRRVRQGNVLYVAAEGGGGFNNRVAALTDPAFWVLNRPFTLAGGNGQASFLAEVIQHLAATTGSPFDLIIFDTLARVIGSLDENAAPAIAELIAGVDLIRRATGAHVMLVHHTGKDSGRGARGHSALRAAIDTEIELTRDDLGEITAEVSKQRDGATGSRFCFHLDQVELGRDEDGDRVTTCVVKHHPREKES